MFLKDWVQHHVQRENLTVLDVIADLPTQRSARVQYPYAFRDYFRLRGHVGIEGRSRFVLLTDVVGWRRNDELHRAALERSHERKIVLAFHRCVALTGEGANSGRHPVVHRELPDRRWVDRMTPQITKSRDELSRTK